MSKLPKVTQLADSHLALETLVLATTLCYLKAGRGEREKQVRKKMGGTENTDETPPEVCPELPSCAIVKPGFQPNFL